jgi:hypothetical protein
MGKTAQPLVRRRVLVMATRFGAFLTYVEPKNGKIK